MSNLPELKKLEFSSYLLEREEHMLKKEKVNETLGNHPRKKFVILNGNTSGICMMIEECTTAAQDVTFKIWGETIFNWGGILLLIHSNLDIANKSVRPFLFTISNKSLYQM